MIYVIGVLGFIAGIGIGTLIGQEYVLYKQKTGYYLPVNPWALPINDIKEKETELRTIATPRGLKINRVVTEEGSINKIKNPKNKDKEKPYI